MKNNCQLGSAEIATNVYLHTSKVSLVNTEDLAHTLYTYTVIISIIKFK